jgi:hypothetical protein
MTDQLVCCHSERKRGIFLDLKIRLNHYRRKLQFAHAFEVLVQTLVLTGLNLKEMNHVHPGRE